MGASVSLSSVIGSNGPHPSLDLVDSALGLHAGTLATMAKSREVHGNGLATQPPWLKLMIANFKSSCFLLPAETPLSG